MIDDEIEKLKGTQIKRDTFKYRKLMNKFNFTPVIPQGFATSHMSLSV